VAQTWVGQNLPVSVAFGLPHERRDECLLMHGRSVA
jgi:hypothetical protein